MTSSFIALFKKNNSLYFRNSWFNCGWGGGALGGGAMSRWVIPFSIDGSTPNSKQWFTTSFLQPLP